MMDSRAEVDVAIVGGGPAGLVAACLFAESGLSTALIAPEPPADARSIALLAGSVKLLEHLGLWPSLRPHAAALERLRIVDATGGPIRAPEVIFSATELGLPAFGYTIPNRVLTVELRRFLETTALLRIEEPLERLEPSTEQAVLRTAGGRKISARLAVGADGRKSLCREAAGIATKSWSYEQSALVVDVAHEKPHENVSTEFHTEEGPFTLAPLPGNRSGIVCVVRPSTADALMRLDDADLAEELGRRSRFILGVLTIGGQRATFPVSGQTALRLGRKRVALIGEAAHVLPPIGAQGLNLGLRDAAHLAEIVRQAALSGRDIGGNDVLAAYESARRADVLSRTLAVGALNRSLLSGLLPAQAARSFGLHLLERVGPLRRRVMREGLMPSSGAPRIMAEAI
jgi:2-octaprenyl-6-methoxyphenol hydroxylase